MLFMGEFRFLQSPMCQTHAPAVSCLRLPGWEIRSFTDESDFKSRSGALMREMWLCFAFWSHGIITNDDYTPLLPKHGQHREESCLWKRGLQVFHREVYVQDVLLGTRVVLWPVVTTVALRALTCSVIPTKGGGFYNKEHFIIEICFTPCIAARHAVRKSFNVV